MAVNELNETDIVWHKDQPDVPGKTAAEMKAFLDAPIHVLLAKINEIIGKSGTEDAGAMSLTELLSKITEIIGDDGEDAANLTELQDKIDRIIGEGVLPTVSGTRSIAELPFGMSMAKDTDEGNLLEITYDPPNVEIVDAGSILIHSIKMVTNETGNSFTYHYLDIFPARSVEEATGMMRIRFITGYGNVKRYEIPFPQNVKTEMQEELQRELETLKSEGASRLSKKQDKLTAGDGIVINDTTNTISAPGIAALRAALAAGDLFFDENGNARVGQITGSEDRDNRVLTADELFDLLDTYGGWDPSRLLPEEHADGPDAMEGLILRYVNGAPRWSAETQETLLSTIPVDSGEVEDMYDDIVKHAPTTAAVMDYVNAILGNITDVSEVAM